MTKNNETFNHEDEWFCLYGPKITKDEALATSDLQWKVIKNKISEVREFYESQESGIMKKQAKFKYFGLLWKYEELIKIMKK